MIATVEIKEDLCSFPMKKRLIKSHNFGGNATIDKIDERCLVNRGYFVRTLKWEC